MSESLIEKYVSAAAVDSANRASSPDFVDFVRKGNHVAFSYHSLLWLRFNPSVGINLHFATHWVTIKGRHLESLYSGFLNRTQSLVVEGSDRHDRGEDSGPMVTEIQVMQKGNAPEPAADAEEV